MGAQQVAVVLRARPGFLTMIVYGLLSLLAIVFSGVLGLTMPSRETLEALLPTSFAVGFESAANLLSKFDQLLPMQRLFAWLAFFLAINAIYYAAIFVWWSLKQLRILK